jgi:inosine-uridine nucleoside N-ribohydrolase
MGGMIEPPIVYGKIIPRGFEYNFCNDSTAIEKIIKAGFNLTIIPGDLTFHQDDPWTDEELAQLRNIKHPATELLLELKDKSLIAMKEGMEKSKLPIDFARPWVNDEFAISYLIEPLLFEVKEIFVKWELPDKYPRLIPAEEGYRLKIVRKTDFVKTKKFIIEMFKKFIF